MGTLTACLRRLAKNIGREDREAILVKAQQYRRTMDPQAAAERAVDEQIAAVQALIETARKPATPQVPAEPGTKYVLPSFVTAPHAKPDKAKLVPYRKEDGSVGYRAEPVAAPAVSANTIFTEDMAAAARARMKAKLGRASSGIDPELLQDGIVLAGYHIERGARTFAAYAKAMMDDMGEGIRPYLKQFYMAVKYDPRGAALSAQMSSASFVDEFDVGTVAAPSDSNAATKPDTGGTDGTATRNLEGNGPGAPAGDAAGAGRAPAAGEKAGRVPDDNGQSGERRDEAADAAGSDVGRGLGTNPGNLVPRDGPAPGGDAGDGRVQGAQGIDSGTERPSDAGGTRGVAPNEPPTPANQFTPSEEDFTIEDDLGLGEGGAKTKYKGNVAAIRLLRDLEASGRTATPTEQHVLARYVGWGQLSNAFEGGNAEWGKEQAELKQMIADGVWTQADYDAAVASTRYAHYTSKPIVQDGIYAALRRFGFTGGRMLEGGAGVGNFIGLMPKDMRSAGRITAVEREPIAAGIAKMLYPLQNVQQQDFTQFKGNDGYFDAAVGNPPFASDSQLDQSGRKHLNGLSLHNYFFAKEVDMLREGGILAQVVTNSFLDSSGDRARRYIGERTKFLGAIRLPNNAFSKNAGTEVTTDLIFLQKLPEKDWGSKAAKEGMAAWMDSRDYVGESGRAVPLNVYFHDHPEMMLGKFGPYGTMYRVDSPALIARDGQDTLALLKEAVQKLPENIYQSIAQLGTDDALEAAAVALNDPPVREGGFFKMEDGRLIQRIPDIAGEARGVEITPATMWTEKTKLGERDYGRLVSLSELRTTMRSLLAAELAGDSKMDALRKTLNQQYDAYTKDYGLLGDRATARVFDDDPDHPLLLSLERDYKPGIGAADAKKLGIKQTKSSAKKMAIFERPVVDARKTVTKVETVEDALNVSMAERGKLDTAYIAELMGKDPQDVLREMTNRDKPLLFLDPATDEYVLRDAYLSGNVRQKLEQARDAAMMVNMRELEAVQPEDVPAHHISAKIGAPWVPIETYEDFAKELLGEGTKVDIFYNKLTSSYGVSITPGSEVNNSNKWGTAKYPAVDIISSLMNNRTIKVTYTDSDKKTHTDVEATEHAQTKAQEVKDRFQDWLFADPDRSTLLTRAYNDANNNYVTRQFDGSHMTFPGKVGTINMRRHQRNAAARIVQDRTTLLDHVVGSGKTYTIVAGAMELRRTGLAKKNMVTVPNHLVKQWAADFYRLYPGANVLAATKKDFERQNRRRFLAKVATGDWDAVIIAHSSYGFIKPGAEFEASFNETQIKLIMAAIKDVNDSDADKGQKKRTVKQLQGMLERLQKRIKALRDKPMDDVLDFEELGVDQLFVDEAHLFKNLMYQTKLQGVAGLGDAAGSKRAYDMYVKTQEVMKKNGRGQGVVFATGTPVSNSLAEKYHMMRYLMPRQMEELGFQSFDAWANTYAEVRQHWMQKTSGEGYKAQTRMSEFVNVHELLKLFDQVADTVTNDDVKAAERAEGREYPLPPIKGGKPRLPVSLERSASQEAYMKDLAVRAAIVEARKRPPQKGEDNQLSLMTDARKAAMDIRLVDLDATEREKGSRIDTAANNIFERYQQWNHVKGTQLVFADLGIPKKQAEKELKEYQRLQGIIAEATDEVTDQAAFGNERAQEIVNAAEDAQAELEKQGQDWVDAVKAAMRGFSIYDDLKDALVERGMPAEQIAFIHDYNTDDQKAGLFQKMNNGDIRVLVGSTPKLGAGTNVQKRMVALHHLDVPWRPSDVEQREGRIVRQGNILFDNPDDRSTQVPDFEVEVLAYVTKDTLDLRMWQIQEAKLKVINQLRTRQIERNIDNAFEDMEMSAGEMQAAATGNMDLLHEITTRNDIKKLENKKRSFEAQKNDLIGRKKTIAQKLQTLPKQIAEEQALKVYADQYKAELAADVQDYKVTIDGKEYTDRTEAGKYLQDVTGKKIYTRTVEKDGKKMREEMSESQIAELQKKMLSMKAASPEQVEAAKEINSWGEGRAAPLDVTMNGEQYTARAKLAEAFSNIGGDRDAFLWKYDGKKFNRRTAASTAVRQLVTDAIADEKTMEIGTVGPFNASVEGEPVDKRGQRVLSMYIEVDGHKIEGHIPLSEESVKNTLGITEKVLDWMSGRAENAGSSVRWLEHDLEKAQQDKKELDSAEELGTWPDQDKLDAARGRHQEILKRLSAAKQHGVGHGSTGTPVVLSAADYGKTYQVPVRPELTGRWVVTTQESGGGFSDAPRDGFASKQDAESWLRSSGYKFYQGESGQGAKTGELQRAMDDITREWGHKVMVSVLPSITSKQVPAEVRAEAQARIARGGGVSQAVTMPNGMVLLFADTMKDPAQAVVALYHEVLGHSGLRGHFGRDLDAHLNTIATLNPGEVRKMIDRLKMDPNDPNTRLEAAEEVLAYMAQEKPQLGLVQRAVAMIRGWLRNHVPFLKDMPLSDGELIRDFILPARRHIEGGGPGGGKGFKQDEANPTYYSALSRGLEEHSAKSLPAAGWTGAIQALVNKGAVRADEVEWSGIKDYLALQGGKVTKEDVLGYLQQHGVRVEETMKGGLNAIREVDDLVVKADALGWTFDRAAFEEDGEYGSRTVRFTRRSDGVVLRIRGDSMAAGANEDGVGVSEDDPIQDIANRIGELADGEQAGDDADGTRYSNYTLPGGENYRELLLTLPDKSEGQPSWMVSHGDGRFFATPSNGFNAESVGRRQFDSLEEARAFAKAENNKNRPYRSNHWDEHNIVAHIRMDERTDADGKKVLFVEELQSDWAQQGRKQGFQMKGVTLEQVQNAVKETYAAHQTAVEANVQAMRTGTAQEIRETSAARTVAHDASVEAQKQLSAFNRASLGAPAGPFVEKTDAWVGLALKRVIKYAVDHGMERVAFVNGKQSADRYSLTKHVSRIRFEDNHTTGVGRARLEGPHAMGRLVAWNLEGRRDIDRQLIDATKELPELIGAELAEKLLAQPGKSIRTDGGNESRVKELSGLDLEVGGEGMKAFYDKIVPAAVNKLLPKIGGGKMMPLSVAAHHESVTGNIKYSYSTLSDVSKPNEHFVIESNDDLYSEPKIVAGPFATDAEASKWLRANDPATRQMVDVGGFDVTPEMHKAVSGGLPLFSQGSTTQRQIQVGPTWRPIETATGELIHPTFQGQQAFWRNFADQFKLDDQGRPIVTQEEVKNLMEASGLKPMFSQAVGLNNPRDWGTLAKNAVAEMNNGASGKLHWWHKTIGTQYNLAQKSPLYKRVFDHVQDFLQDVSLYATEAADKAPSILPKLETWRDILPAALGGSGKKPLSVADNKAIAAPIFEGTLAWARDKYGNPINIDDMRERAKLMTADEKGQQMVRNNQLSPNVLRMWKGLPYEQFNAMVESRFENTALQAGVVWTSDELRKHFNLTDAQIGQYREFRSSVDESITRAALADMVRYVGKDADFIREEVMGSVGVVNGMNLLIEQLKQLAQDEPARAGDLQKTIDKLEDKGRRAQDLMDRGYAPLSRFGHHTVTVYGPNEDTGEEEVQYFGMYESALKARLGAEKMAKTFEGEPVRIERGTMNEDAYKLFAGISPETIELFGEMLGMDATGDSATDQAFQAYLKLARNSRSAMKRLIHRKGTEGFSEDVGRVLAGFTYSTARMTSRNLHAGQIAEAVRDIQLKDKNQGELARQATRLMEYVNNPQEEAQKLRGLLFAQYLGGSIAAALVNMTQPFQVTMPYLSQFGGISKSAKRMTWALANAWKKSTGDAALDRDMQRAVEEGVVAPQEVHQLMAQGQAKGSLMSGDGTMIGNSLSMMNNYGRRLAAAWGKPFSTAELFNRRVTFAAAYRTAQEQGIDNPFEFAKKAVTETQFLYNKGNRPEWARGAVGATLMTFKQYSISYLELVQRMWTAGAPGSEERAAGRRAVFFAAGMLMLMGGAGGFPFVEDVEDVIDGIMQRLGYNWSSKQKMREMLQEAFGKAFGGFLEKGVTGLPGAPIDVSARLGMGNLIPGTGLFTKKKDHASDVLELAGPTGDLVQRAGKALSALGDLDPMEAARQTSPKAMRDLAKAMEMMSTGQYKDDRHRKVLDVTGTDAVMKGIGFQPGDVATVQEGDRAAQGMIAQVAQRREEISEKWAQGLSEHDQSLQQEARREVNDWNEKNPETPIRIRMQDIIRRAHKMNESRTERIAQSAPKALRQEVRRLTNQ